jgi:hypothetical protein
MIGSIELYLAIQKSMESELISQRDYYLLGVDIYKTLSLSQDHRPIPAKDYLEKCYNSYCKLMESSNALSKKLEDKLCPLPLPLISVGTSDSSSPSSRLNGSGSGSNLELGLSI